VDDAAASLMTLAWPTGDALPRRGDFDHLCAIGGFTPRADDAHRRLTYHGLVLETSSCYGTFRDAAGTVCAVRRGFGWDWARPLVVHSGAPGILRVDADVLAEAWSGSGLQDQVVGGIHEYRSPARHAGAGFVLRRGLAGLEWREDGTLHLEGRPASSSGLQWYDPSPPGAAYASVFFRTAGVILDHPVEGFLVSEQRYLPSGHLWSDGPYARAWRAAGPLLIAWTAFATEWDDGRVELGHLCAGRRSWGFAMVTDAAGPTVLTTTIERAAADPGESLRFRTPETTWEWALTGGATLEALRPFERRDTLEGIVRRVGDPRRPVVWMARLERPDEEEES
jgi:hypothetical protein